jgi:alkyldihydroxyacetonephosphate synthase
MSNEQFTPPWCEQEAPQGSYRSLFKYGDPLGFKHPNRGLYKLVKEVFDMTDADFQKPNPGTEILDVKVPIKLATNHIKKLTAIVGAENVRTDTYSRTRAAYGAGMIDALRLRNHIIENIADVVLCPRSTADIEAIVQYCDKNRIPLYVYGGGSTVTRGMEAVKGGVSLDMSVHMNKVVEFNETNHTITVQAGIWGPELERILQNAPETLKASRRYTCGHFPQSFEHSSVGGWVVTRGAGQNSTYYGKIEDMVIAQEYVTPIGIFKTQEYPRAATGPDFDQVMMGSEGTFGVLISVTLRVCRWDSEHTRRYSYLFKSWEEARTACREIMQGEFGFPSVFRLSDPEETDVAMRTYHIHETAADKLLRTLGYQPMQRCLLLGTVDGDPAFSRLVNNKVRSICKKHGAFTLTPFGVTKAWERSRFTDPFMREDLMDFGIMIDTLECGVNWAQMEQVHAEVRKVVKARPQTVCMTHLSHAYPQGANLYFIFIARITDINEYLTLQYSILKAIQKAGATMSHHHGIGKQTAPWLEEQIGKPAMDVIRTLRDHFDPHHIMNPGGTLGLDMSAEQKAKRWGFRPEKSAPKRALSKAELERDLQKRRQKYN